MVELDLWTGGIGESGFEGGSPFTGSKYNESPPIIEKLTITMATKNSFNKYIC